MKAIIVEEPGDASNLKLADLPDPAIGDTDLLVKVHATALNRADTLQRMGQYPAQQGASEVLGLELAGEVVGLGSAVDGFAVGDRVYGLSGGGGYGELAALDQSLAMPIPDGWDYATAASIPVPTVGGSVISSGTAWRCMLDPIRARLASSCSRKGINPAETPTI